MRVFHIKGLSGLLMFILGLIGTIALTVLLPTSFIMVLWNATAFEGLGSVEIGMGEASLLWAALLALVYAIFKPQVSFHFKRVAEPGDLRELKKTDSEE